MKKTFVLLGSIVLVLVMGGCRSSSVNVIVKDGGRFPSEIAGRWKNEETGWEFVFEPDGTISSAVIDSGFIAVEPAKGIARKPMLVGESIYKLGKWTVQYNPKTYELAVEVVVDFYHVDIGKEWLEGNRIDWFKGPVSRDYKLWETQWIAAPKYIAYTPEPGELPVDPNETVKELLFEKVSGNVN